jgi:hypothetical protein
VGEFGASGRRKRGEESASLLFGSGVEGTEDGAATGGELEIGGAVVALRDFAGGEGGLLEFGEDAAEVAGVEAEGFADLLCLRCGAASGELVDDAAFGEGEFGAEKAFAQGAEETSIEAVEAAEGDGMLGEGGIGDGLAGAGRGMGTECADLVDCVK